MEHTPPTPFPELPCPPDEKSLPSGDQLPLPPEAASKKPQKAYAIWNVRGPLLGALILIGIVAAVGFGMQRSKEEVLIPTLNLQPADLQRPGFFAHLLGEVDGIPTYSETATEVTAGFTAAKDAHQLFECPAGIPGIEVAVAHGDPEIHSAVRSWGYEYSGNEEANKAAGETGLELFDGRFWLSDAELAVSGGIYGYLNTPGMQMVAGKRYYVMIDGVTGAGVDVRISCEDREGDFLNNAREDLNSNLAWDPGETKLNDADSDEDGLIDGEEVVGGDRDLDGDGLSQPFITNPTNPDTDGDGVQDGTEQGRTVSHADTDTAVFVPDADSATTTDPMGADTDRGGASDGFEDVNKNGKVDPGDTSPLDPADDPVCGDGVIKASEVCDDANILAGDGCASTCTVESGFACTGEPSICTPS